jgi:hypothetical protein
MNTIALKAVVVLTLFMSGFGIGHHLEAEKFDAYKAEVTSQSLAQQKLNETTITQYKQTTQEAKYAADIRVANVLALYKRMRLEHADSNNMPQAGATTSIADEYSPNNLPSSSRLAEDCAVTTVNFITLQEWAKGITK